jgi:hypothetical protein
MTIRGADALEAKRAGQASSKLPKVDSLGVSAVIWRATERLI